MGKLNIAHHKSYHPYRRDNIERVRRDEEEARLKEEKEEGRMLLADAEARIELLRERASVSTKDHKKKLRDDEALDAQLKSRSSSTSLTAELPTTNGHINFFGDLEQGAIAVAIKASSKKAAPAETEKGVPLAPSAKDLKPWYSDRNTEQREDDVPEDRRKREDHRKSEHDPLTSITKKLASRPSTSLTSTFSRPRHPQSSSSFLKDAKPEVQARLSREQSERERALELIRRKKREMAGADTPSTVYGGSEYSDQFNKREVQDAHKERDRRWDRDISQRRWDDDDRHRGRRSEDSRSKYR